MDEHTRFQVLSELFDEAVVLQGHARQELIARRCAGDDVLEREVWALLEADDTADPDAFVMGLVVSEAAALGQPDVAGRVLGSWRILRRLGEGGMGTVYLAERADGAYEALAAVKLVRGGVLSPRLAEGFRAERQILAGLSHPGVAQLLDGGSTDDGTPFLVMEFVDGRPITEWCDALQLGIAERLRLFLKVADAVSYAHGALVAHRDLKPSNILVGDDGEPKLLDFGIAKLMDSVDEAADGMTQSYRALTPAYSSPEQVSGRRAGVASDVYALGVLLYELLSGRLPLSTRGLTPLELSRRIVEEVPPVLSSVVEARDVKRRLSGDLDAIVSRALRKEPEARYPSVEALSDDVRLHIEGRPIRARRNDWAYRTGKTLRRNRGMVSLTVVVALLMIGFTVNTALQSRAVALERDRAQAERVRAEQVSLFLEELFTEADPNESAGREVTAREVLDRGAERVLAEFASDAETQASLAMVMGRVYRGLGEYEASRPLLDSALAARMRTPDVGAVSLGQSLFERAALAYDLGDYESSLEMYQSSLEAFERESVGDEALIASAKQGASHALMDLGRMDEAEPLQREAVTIYRQLSAGPSEELASALISLTDVLRDRGAFDEAIAVGEEALEMTRALYGDTHLELASALNQHASTLSRSGRPADAVPLVREGLRIRREIRPGPHAETAASLGNLAGILGGLERFEEAEAARRESLQMMTEIFGDDHPYVAGTTFSLAEVVTRLGRLEEAERLLLLSVEQHRAAFSPTHPNVGYPLTSLGRLYLARGDLAAAESALREAYELRSGGLPEGHWHIAASGLELGRAVDALGREEEAEALLVESFDLLRQTFGEDDTRADQARTALRDHLLRRGLTERAAELPGD